MDKKSSRSIIFFSVFTFVIYLSFNVISNNLIDSKIDMTEEKLYTISKGTKEILSSIDEPISVKLFFSKKLGEEVNSYKQYFNRVKTLLKNYEKLSNGKVQLKILYPQTYSELEDEAISEGLSAVNITELGEQVYFGLVVKNSVDEKETIAFFNLEREDFLEYDLSKIIYKLSTTTKTKVGVISGLIEAKSFTVFNQLREFVDLKFIEEGEGFEELSSLVVVNPSNLEEKTLLEIEQFVLNGGNTLIFTDPYLEESHGRANTKNSKLVEKIFKEWGVTYSSDNVSVDVLNAVRVRMNTSKGPAVVPHGGWISLNSNSFDKESVITSNLETLSFANSGFFQKEKEGTTTVTPLISTSKNAKKVSSNSFKFIYDISQIKKVFRKGDERLDLAVHVKGSVKTAFEKGVFNQENNETIYPSLEESKEDVNVILVGDIDMLYDQRWAQVRNFFGRSMLIPTADNGKFVINAVENLSGNDAFIALRGRGKSVRPFTYLGEIKKEAELKFLEKEEKLKQKLLSLQNQINSEREPTEEAMLSKKQKELIEKANKEMINVRKELRAVQHDLRKDIEATENSFKWINILALPIIVALFGAFFILGKRKSY